MTKDKTSGFGIIDWDERVDMNVVGLKFDKTVLESLSNYRTVPQGYCGEQYNPCFGDIYLIIEDIADGLYHVSLRDYSFGWTKDLGDGLYDYIPSTMPGWSNLERSLTDLLERLSKKEIDLNDELTNYYLER